MYILHSQYIFVLAWGPGVSSLVPSLSTPQIFIACSRKYKIGISEAETGQTDYVYTSDSTTLKTFYNQHPYYHYDITVAAYTIGYGPFSHPAVRVHMLEAGKKHLAM